MRNLHRSACAGGAEAWAAQAQGGKLVAHVYATGFAQERTGGGALCDPVQLAGWALGRDLFVGVSAPGLPMRGVHVCGGGDSGRAELKLL